MKLLIKNGTIIDPMNKIHSKYNVVIEDGIVIDITEEVPDCDEVIVPAADSILTVKQAIALGLALGGKYTTDPSTTDIEKLETAPNAQPSAIYDLMGRKVNTVTSRGIYIVGGKKVVTR